MWNGSPDCSAGSQGYSSPKKSAELLQKSLSDGMENTAPYCELREKLQADLAPIASPHHTEVATTSSHLIISPTCMEKWLGNSKEPLSRFELIAIRLRIGLRSGVFSLMAAVVPLVFGMLICKDLPKALHSGNSHPAVQLQVWPCFHFPSFTAKKIHF